MQQLLQLTALLSTKPHATHFIANPSEFLPIVPYTQHADMNDIISILNDENFHLYALSLLPHTFSQASKQKQKNDIYFLEHKAMAYHPIYDNNKNLTYFHD
ncbi:hypothetical protein [Bartonella sp. AD13SXNS]|uniref:hypothetical protein n=1 Tax=Bartonella sp. AD13SXNS TaxID=3243462 RepID=UPI0035D07B2D